MNKIKITLDSSSDLTDEILERFSIAGVVPLHVVMGDKSFRDDRIETNNTKIAAYVKESGKLAKTAAVSDDDYKQFFGSHTADGSQIIHFTISKELSTTYDNAIRAAKDFPTVSVVDAGQLSAGTALFALYASDLIKENPEITQQEILQKLSGRIAANHGQSSCIIDTLEYLRKGGRCSTLALLGANLLKLHPSIHAEKGRLVVGKKFRGKMVAVTENYLEHLKAQNPNIDDTYCFVIYTHFDTAPVDLAVAKVKELFNFKEIFVVNAGATIFCHTGPNALGLLFLRK